MFNYSKLYGKIKEVYGTHEAFAKDMGMSRSALSSRLKNRAEWKSKEMFKACELLYIPLADCDLYFFSVKSLEKQD